MKAFIYTGLILNFTMMSANAQVGFDEIIISDNADAVHRPFEVAYGDLDGDGDQDIITTSHDDDKVAWIPNADGNGTFGAMRLISQLTNGVRDVDVGDVDGDGALDIVVASQVDDKLSWFANLDGKGNFSSRKLIPKVQYESGGVHLADIDGDGDLDLLTYGGSGSFFYHENLDGNGTFDGSELILQEEWSARDVNTADIDGDGFLDLLVCVNVDTYWCRNLDGEGSFSLPILISNTENHPVEVVAADFDGDGYMDVATTIFYNNKLMWYKNGNGTGDFTTKVIIDSTSFAFGDIATADVDDDGDMDILATSRDADMLALYRNDGLGQFDPREEISTSENGISDVKVTDFDSDGDLDLLISTQYNQNVSWYENVNGTGAFEKRQTVTAPVADKKTFAMTDMDNDGDLDAVYMIKDTVYSQESMQGGSWNGTPTAIVEIEFVESINSMDVDKDGDQDLLLASQQATLLWLENTDGMGTYGPPQTLMSGFSSLRAIEVTDLDGDGYTDIITASSNQDKVQYHRYIDSTGTYGPYVTVTKVGSGINDIDVADMNQDGLLDIVSVNSSSTDLVWYPNLDTLGFGSREKIDYSSGQSRNIALGDMDGDGDIDVVRPNAIGLYLYTNEDGLGTFSNEVQITTEENNFVDVYATDLDQDGDLDIVSSGLSENKLLWFENIDGLGTFIQRTVDESLLIEVEQLRIEDINADGVVDIVALTYDSKLAWYKNEGLNLNKIVGLVSADTNADSCQTTSASVPNMTITATDVISSVAALSLEDRLYNIYVEDGVFDVSLTTELPSQWTALPMSQELVFDSLGVIDTVNFCLIANESVQDVNVAILPLTEARPGFSTTYQVIINNLGSTIVDGTVNIQYDNAKLNYVATNTAISQINSTTLQLAFDKLKPFESRAYDVQFIVETIPTVSLMDVLEFALLIDVGVDDHPYDNEFEFSHEIIGSYDPNNIHVAQGSRILLDQKDDYLHYRIRFQNTGTASAINVRVENTLDEDLDWNTFELLSTSHPVVTDIMDGNQVFFHFDDIYLPDSLTSPIESQGYINYRVKPIGAADIGYEFENIAEIYFDFNPAIITNMVTTTIVHSTKTIDAVTLADLLYPNPTSGLIQGRKGLSAEVLIYTLDGQFKWSGDSDAQMDISQLPSGTYLVNLKFADGRELSQLMVKL